tara:strand:- start:578 stop:976 length:399 start_codon:yes stop_codon:yes gene_type:complete
MKYLNEERPPVPPTLADAVAYLRPGLGWWTDIDDKVIFMDENGQTHPDNDSLQITEEEEKDFFENANIEWERLKEQQELRRLIPPKDRLMYYLWKDMHNGTIPGKDGIFYKSIHSVIAKYSEGKDSTLYPYD